MAARGASEAPASITDARFGASLSTDQRTRRYVITMAFRVAAFLIALFCPLPWNVILFAAAALLPAAAVLLANTRDNLREPLREDGPEPQLALTPGVVVPGTVAQPTEDR